MAADYDHANVSQRKQLLQFAYAFGRSYQIYDDLVDVVETSKEAGKKTHKDLESGKNNTLTLLGVSRSRKELTELMTDAQSCLKSIDATVLAGFLDLYKKVL